MTPPEQKTNDRLAHLLDLYRTMLLIRRTEDESARAYAQGKIGGFLHLYIGQEAVAVGACAALEPGDYVIGTYRDHGLAIAKGMSPKKVLAELYGKATGCSRGLGGSMHLFDAEHRMMGGYGIVGGHIPLSTGLAFASKYQKTGRVTVCFFGDGAVSIGAFHESLSLAALLELPVVFVCENNQYAMGTSLARTLSVSDISQKAVAYGMARDRFLVRDVLEVEERISEAVTRARTKSEPTLVEARTYRYRGHSMSDPAKYRTELEVEEHRKADAVTRARTELLEAGLSDRVVEVEASVEREVKDALDFAEESQDPDPGLLESTTYAGPFAR